jgi:hypothetical protein
MYRLYYLTVLLPLLCWGAAVTAATSTEAQINQQIARLTAIEESGNIQPEECFELGTLYWAKRDYARRSYTKNDLSRRASGYFSSYAQKDEIAARDAIALFCVERIRQSPNLGIRASDDFLACSTMVTRYVAKGSNTKASS